MARQELARFLRDRREDIPLLAAHFLDRISREHNRKFTLSDEALRTMMRHDWPGNVRELENSLARATALSSGPVLRLCDLPTQLQQQGLQQDIDARRAGALEEASAPGLPDVKPLAALERGPPSERPALYGDGHAGERVVAALTLISR